MYNSILQFIKKDTKKIEKLMTEHLLSGNMLRFEEGLMDAIIEFGRELYQEVLGMQCRRTGQPCIVSQGI